MITILKKGINYSSNERFETTVAQEHIIFVCGKCGCEFARNNYRTFLKSPSREVFHKTRCPWCGSDVILKEDPNDKHR